MTTIGSKLVSMLRRPAVWLPAIILAAATALFRYTDLDLALVRPFFSGDGANPRLDARWPLMVVEPWNSLYVVGLMPAWILGAGGLAVWILSFFHAKFRQWRDPGLFLALVLVIGPGIIVNGILKPSWNRPRPHAIGAFGGPRPFLPALTRGNGVEDSSFPSGHAAMGFYLMTPAFIFWRRRPWLAAGFLLFGLCSGTVMGITRMVAGGHFPSDILWSGAIVYFTGLALAAMFRLGAEEDIAAICIEK